MVSKNTILVAYNCRTNPNRIEGKRHFSQKEIDQLSTNEEPGNGELNVTVVWLGAVEQIKLSVLLSNDRWRVDAI